MIIVDSWGIRDLDIISSFVAFSRYDTRRVLRRQPQWKLSSFLSINLERVQVSELYSTADKTSALYKLHLRCTLSCLLFQRFWKLANRCLPSASLQLTSCRSPCFRLTYDPRYLNASMFSNSFPRTSLHEYFAGKHACGNCFRFATVSRLVNFSAIDCFELSFTLVTSKARL